MASTGVTTSARERLPEDFPKEVLPPGAKSSKPQVARPLISLPSEAEYTEGETLLSPSHHSGILRCSIYLKTSCPQTQQGRACHPEVLYPPCLVLLPPISTHHFSQGPTTSGFESARLSRKQLLLICQQLKITEPINITCKLRVESCQRKTGSGRQPAGKGMDTVISSLASPRFSASQPPDKEDGRTADVFTVPAINSLS